MLIMLMPAPVPGLVSPLPIPLAVVADAVPDHVVPVDAGSCFSLAFSSGLHLCEARFFIVKNLTPCRRILILNCK
jgi:hypothetical protein